MKGRERCRLHGGKTPRGRNGGHLNENHKHGLYSSTLSPEEQALWNGIDLNSMDDALRLCHIQLRRAVNLEAQIARSPNSLHNRAGLELTELRRSSGDFGISTDAVSKRPDLAARQDRLLGRIGQLTKLRAELITTGSGGESDPATDQARRIKEALDAIDRAIVSRDDDNDE